jgi:hypothetical protein
MPDEPRQTIPELLGTIRAGRRSAQVDRLLLGWFEGRDEVATALIDLAHPDLPVMRHRLGETDDPSSGAVGLSKTLSREDGLAIVAPEYRNGYPGCPQECVRLSPCGHPAAQAHRHRQGFIGRVRRPQLPRPVAAGLPSQGGVSRSQLRP